MLLILYSLLPAALLVGASSSSVSVAYPLDDQLPPIARVHTPFSWTFLPDTFVSDTDAAFNYSASSLPSWLSFDPNARTLHGTPSAEDEGAPKITVTAMDFISGGTASDDVTLCVTSFPPPQLKIPVEKQFYDKNPSLSSVFLITNSSALYKSRPALRIPPKWSFSIGFQYDTFSADHSLFYAARKADGSQLPDWVNFNEHDLTFGGVTPHRENLTLPHTVSLVLHASDQEGYSAASVPFDIVISDHDFSLATNSLPTINVTTDQPFKLTLNSPVDFSGVLIDGDPISPTNITSLNIDTSDLEGWLHYDLDSRTLSGEPPAQFSVGDLPVVLTSNINQTLYTDVTLRAVPSFFSGDNLDPILVKPGDQLSFNLAWYFSNSSGLGKNLDVELSASYVPLEAGYFLTFDRSSDQLTGTIPANTSYDHIAVTFTAYSHITHSTSHTALPVSLSSSDFEKQHNQDSSGGLSGDARSKLLLGLKIAFAIICGFVILAIIFAVVRRCTRVPDSAVLGEEGRKAWTAEELKWYGIGIEVNGEKYTPSQPAKSERGYGWSEDVHGGSHNKQGLSTSLSRALTRTFSNSAQSPFSPVGLPQNPGMVKKVEFLGKVRATARIVSDKYRRVVSGPRRPIISKPTLILTGDNANTIPPARSDIDGLPFTNPAGLLPLIVQPLSNNDLRAFETTNFSQYVPSDMSTPTDSPSSSTGGRSIPRRRADFAPPKNKNVKAPPQAHLRSNRSVDSIADSIATESSTRTHEAEAVIQRATRATSVRSAHSGFSFNGEDGRQQHPGGAEGSARPRLVPFTSATRVPVPKLPSSFFSPDPGSPAQPDGQRKTKRVASQMAKVFRNANEAAQADAKVQGQAEGAADELRAGIEFVRALGDDGRGAVEQRASQDERSPAASAMSFTSLESSQPRNNKRAGREGPSRSIATPAPRMLARTGERFKVRVPVMTQPNHVGQGQEKKRRSMGSKDVEVRLTSGRALPKFMKVDLDAIPSGAGARLEKRVVEMSGVPQVGDVGVYEVGVYEKEGGECVGRVIVEVVQSKSG